MVPTSSEHPSRARHALPRLVVELTGDHALTVMRPRGEVDIETVDLFTLYAMQALSRRPRQLVVDLSGVTFFSAAGLHVLTQMQQTAQAEEMEFRLRSPSSIARLVLNAASYRVRFVVEEQEDGPAEHAPLGFADAAAPGSGRAPRHRLH